jgi:hypothetical protein
MKADLEFEEHDGYLSVRIPFCDSVDQAYAYAKSIVQECAARKFSKVLLDALSTPKAPPIMYLYELGVRCATLPVGHLKVACVVRPEATYPDRFFENVLQNRGVNYQWFLDAEQALQWLNEPAPQSGLG